MFVNIFMMKNWLINSNEIQIENISRSFNRSLPWNFSLILSNCNWNRNHNQLIHKRTLNHLAILASWELIRWSFRTSQVASLAKPLSVCLWTNWLWVWVQLQSLTLPILNCFKQRVSWHSSKYRVWTVSKMRTWHEKNIQLLL